MRHIANDQLKKIILVFGLNAVQNVRKNLKPMTIKSGSIF